MSFDKTLAKQIQEESEKALQTIAKKYNVTIKGNGGTLGDNDFSMKMKIELVGVAKTYPDYVFTMLGLPTDIIGKSFVSGGITMTISDLAPNRPKFPIIANGGNGKSYKFTPEAVKLALKLK